MLTDCFASDDSAATARRTGFVKRAAQMTGQLLLAWGTFGPWSAAHPSLAQWAAQVPQLDAQLEVAPAALYQRLPQSAWACLQALLRHALAKVQALTYGCDVSLLPALPKGSLAASPGVALPHTVHELLPGSGGRAAKAGAQMQAVWASTSSMCAHFVLTPWKLPEQRYLDRVIACAQQGGVVLLA